MWSFFNKSVLVLVILSLVGAQVIWSQYDKYDSGWVDLYDGTFDNMKIYTKGKGYLTESEFNSQSTYFPEGDVIKVCCNGSNGLIGPDSNFSYYWVRVKYQWGENEGSGANAGLMVHVDLNSTVTSDNRPPSAELNMRRDKPGSIWMSKFLGPSAYTYVNGNDQFTPQSEGGTYKFLDPKNVPSDVRMMENCCGYNSSNLEVDINDRDAWNSYLAKVYGGDSVIVIINDKVLSKIYDLRTYDENISYENSPSTTSGGIGLQWEQADIFYKEFELIGVDSVTKLPLVPACMDESFTEYQQYQQDFPANAYTLFSDQSKCQTKLGVGGKFKEENIKFNILNKGSTILFSNELYARQVVVLVDVKGKPVIESRADEWGNFEIKKMSLNFGVYFIIHSTKPEFSPQKILIQ